jgi:hypothetical protein
MVDMSKARVITLSIVASIPISVVGFVLYFFIFKRLIPDCGPTKPIGQCGLATFIYFLYAPALSAISWPVAAIVIAWRWLHRIRAQVS